MSTERTLSIIKPDATKRNITGKIISCFEESGLNIIAQKKILLTKERAEGFYSVHSDKPFFADLVSFMTSAPIIVVSIHSRVRRSPSCVTRGVVRGVSLVSAR